MDLKLKVALSEAVELWMDVEGVNGVAISKKEGADCLLVTVITKTPEVERNIPSEFKGYPVEIWYVLKRICTFFCYTSRVT